MAYMAPTPLGLITVVETREFQQRAKRRMSETEREAFIFFIAEHPETGDIMAGSGGVRVIYYYHSARFPLFLITVFAKNEKSNLNQREKNEIKQLTSLLVETYERSSYEQSRRKHHRRS